MGIKSEIKESSPDYKELLELVRRVLKNICIDAGLTMPDSGLICINSSVIENSNIFMKSFPLADSIVKSNVPQKYYIQIIDLINRKRPYSIFYHHKNSHDIKNLTSSKYYKIPFPKEDAVSFTKEYFDSRRQITWEYMIENQDDSKLRNYLDLCCFRNESNDFISIPLPILSTPTILIMVENNYSEEELAIIIRGMTIGARDVVYSFVFNVLIKNLTNLIKDDEAIVETELDLVKVFCDELNKVLLPVAFQLDGVIIEYVSDWPRIKISEENEMQSKLVLSLNQYQITFYLTSFHIPIANHLTSTNWIHATEAYDLSKLQLRKILENIYLLLFEQWKDIIDVRSQARKSAMSAIMSRNMSHNIGSHVLSGVGELLMSDKLDRLELLKGLDVVDQEQDVHKFKDIDKSLLSKTQNKWYKIVETEYKNDIALAKVNRHLQERMEFIADINMSSIFMYNNLKLDRVIRSFQENYFFLSKLSNDAKINIITISKCNISIDELYLSMPNDNMGVHALYIIIENIIRNSVKHSNLNLNYNIPSLTITIQVSDSLISSDFYSIDIIDNLGESNKVVRSELKNNIIKEIQDKIDSDILKKGTSEIRNGAWGLFEMKYAASYLINNLSSNKNLIKENPFPILAVNYYNDKGDISNSHYNLGYRFFVKKPKSILVLVKNDSAIKEKRVKALSSIGVSILYVTEKTDISIDESYIIVLHPFTSDFLDSINQRSVSYKNLVNELNNILLNGKKDEIQCFAWKLWCEKNNFSNYEICINQIIDKPHINCALFDSHADIRKSLSNKKLPSNIKYYEPYGSLSVTGKLVSGDIFLQKKYSIIESIDTQIAVIDERIQNAMEERDVNLSTFTKRMVYEEMGVFMPKKCAGNSIDEVDLELYVQNEELQKGKLEEYLNFCLHNEKIRYVVIHLTLFELLSKNKSKNGIREKLDGLLENYSSAKKFIVFTSGRGIPSNLPENTFFLHYTTLQNYMVYNQSKYPLVQVLYALRPK